MTARAQVRSGPHPSLRSDNNDDNHHDVDIDIDSTHRGGHDYAREEDEEEGEAEDDESQQFWDVQTTADPSPSSSPPAGVRPIPAAPAPVGRSTSRHLREASFTTAVEFGASVSKDHTAVPELESLLQSPTPTETEPSHQTPFRSNSADSSAPGSHSESSPAIESVQTLRRKPASYSSHGVATSDGPPIALLNRRSTSREAAKRSPPSRTFLQRSLQPLQLLASRSNHKDPDVEETIDARSATAEGRQDRLWRSHTAPMDAQTRDSRQQSQSMNAHGQALHYTHLTGPDMQTQDLAESGTEGQSSEDVFLNLAQDSPNRPLDPVQDKLERRRSRLSRPSQRQSLPTTTYFDRADSSDIESVNGPPSAYENNQRIYGRRPSQIATAGLGNYRESSPASSLGGIEPSSRLDQYRQRYFPLQKGSHSVASGPKSPEMPTYNRRRPSLSSELPSPNHRGQSYRPSKLNSTLQDFDSSSNIDTPLPAGRNRALSAANGDGNESVLSGPSTMWDELEELKSRIKRMERNGVPGSTSGAAVQSSTSGSNERPRTATTTVTTISSSPKHNKNNRKAFSPTAPSASEDKVESAHRLLHEALARSKTVLSPTAYLALETAAYEAIEIASMANSTGLQGPIYTVTSAMNSATMSERQMRRRADNMCRSLTELSIALCDKSSGRSMPSTGPNSPAVVQSIETGPGTQDGSSVSANAHDESPATGAYARHALRSSSLEPEALNVDTRSTPSRALSRIEARRNSLNLLGLSNGNSNSPRESRVSDADELLVSEAASQQQRVLGIPNRFSRAGTSLLRSRRRVGDDETDGDPTIRPMSRAMTDISTPRESKLRVPSLREHRNHRLSREYTSSKPLPEHASSVSSSTNSLRRVTGSNLPQSPLLNQEDGNRRYINRGAPPVAYDSNDHARVLSSSTHLSASRRSSVGVNLTSRKPRQSGLAVEAGEHTAA